MYCNITDTKVASIVVAVVKYFGVTFLGHPVLMKFVRLYLKNIFDTLRMS